MSDHYPMPRVDAPRCPACARPMRRFTGHDEIPAGAWGCERGHPPVWNPPAPPDSLREAVLQTIGWLDSLRDTAERAGEFKWLTVNTAGLAEDAARYRDKLREALRR